MLPCPSFSCLSPTLIVPSPPAATIVSYVCASAREALEPQRRRENWCFARSLGARRILGLLFTLHNPEKFRSLAACTNLPSDFFPLRLASSWRPQLSSCASICTCNPMASNSVSATRRSGRWELKSRFEAPCTRPGADSFCAGLASLIQQMRILTSLKRRLCGFDFLLSRS